MNNIYQIIAEDFNDVRLKCNLNTRYLCLYDTLKNIEYAYNEDLQDLFILSKPRSLKLFFRSINERLKYLHSEFSTMDDGNIKNEIINEILVFIRRNLQMAKNNMTKEKNYTFKSEGCLDHNDPVFTNT